MVRVFEISTSKGFPGVHTQSIKVSTWRMMFGDRLREGRPPRFISFVERLISGREASTCISSSTSNDVSRFHGRRDAEQLSQPGTFPPTYSSRRRREGFWKVLAL